MERLVSFGEGRVLFGVRDGDVAATVAVWTGAPYGVGEFSGGFYHLRKAHIGGRGCEFHPEHDCVIHEDTEIESMARDSFKQAGIEGIYQALETAVRSHGW